MSAFVKPFHEKSVIKISDLLTQVSDVRVSEAEEKHELAMRLVQSLPTDAQDLARRVMEAGDFYKNKLFDENTYHIFLSAFQQEEYITDSVSLVTMQLFILASVNALIMQTWQGRIMSESLGEIDPGKRAYELKAVAEAVQKNMKTVTDFLDKASISPLRRKDVGKANTNEISDLQKKLHGIGESDAFLEEFDRQEKRSLTSGAKDAEFEDLEDLTQQQLAEMRRPLAED